MKLLVIGLLACAVSTLLIVALLIGYRHDQQVIRWFPGTGIAGKIDMRGSEPAYVAIRNRANGTIIHAPVLADGTFIAPLDPGDYLLEPSNDGRSVSIHVPNGDCVDLVLDFRMPLFVLRVPREGWPLPQLA